MAFSRGVAALLACAAMSGVARAGGDMEPEVYSPVVVRSNVNAGDVIEGCAGGETNRLLLRYAMKTHNIGDEDIVLGNPGCPDCRANPGAECTNPLFLCSTAHGHAHFENFAVADLLTAAGEPVIQGRKYGFCLLDTECPTRVYTCQNQGISAGCSDVYGINTSCQYIDLTDIDLPTGSYRLRVEVDPDDKIAEDDDGNNVVELPLELTCANTPDGMRCDDGDACTIDDRCIGDDCIPAPLAQASSRLKLRKGAVAAGDRMVLSARFDAGWMSQPPTESGVEISLTDEDGNSVFTAFVPPAGFEAIGGGDYVFRDPDREFEEAAGITRLRVHLSSARNRVVVRTIAESLDLSAEALEPVLRLTQVFGSGPAASCLAEQALACRGSATSRTCTN
ncbi:MAG TPA: lysyl oxidase family protein [Candidatus Limnocylindrales bacterium]|nr:lysyl oxidase family protein [Candidatus Limnocylindrales bacterium]